VSSVILKHTLATSTTTLELSVLGQVISQLDGHMQGNANC